jgi:hypothetical protein
LVSMALRSVYLAVLRVFGWLGLLLPGIDLAP